ncbi:MAG: hypothetical protein ABGW99_09565 [Zunongwangia sp.]|uniref:hypothetical protein n=1 Tax=Zunongwangia sp. TaxID=1965325 RepID=UPI003242EFC3
MWTPEEKEKRTNELLEFLNNELKAHGMEEQYVYTRDKLKEPGMLYKLNLSFEALGLNITYQIHRRLGGQEIELFDFKTPKGVTRYITSASLEEIEELEDKIEYHKDTLVFLGHDHLLED